MKEKTAQISTINGIRNVVDSERLSTGDLVAGVNIDLDVGGKPTRRLGADRRVTGTPKGLWSGDGRRAYYQDGTDLKEFTPPAATRVVRASLSVNARPVFETMNGVVYYTNGLVTGSIVNGETRSWGTPVPALPSVVVGAGNLKAGTYGWTMSFVRRNGQESGCHRMLTVEAGDNASLIFTMPTTSDDAEVTHKNLFITGCNGEEPFLVGTVPLATATSTYASERLGSVIADTMFKGPPPPGHLLCAYNGRIFIAQDKYLFYTDPSAPELVNYRKNFIFIGAEPTVLAPTKSGIYVATRGEHVFLNGDSPEKFVLQPLAPYGAPIGNAVLVDGGVVLKDGVEGACIAWMSNEGVVVGDGEGNLRNLNQRRYVTASAERASTTFKQRSGLTQFISTLYR